SVLAYRRTRSVLWGEYYQESGRRCEERQHPLGGTAGRLAGGRSWPGRSLLRRRLRGDGGRAIPSARRGRHVDRIVGLGFGGKGLDRELCCRQRLGIEALGNIVAFTRCVRVALRSRQTEPFEGF